MDRLTAVRDMFNSRLSVLSHLLDVAEKHFSQKDDPLSIFSARLAEDMLPL
jgi:hypothetical protein